MLVSSLDCVWGFQVGIGNQNKGGAEVPRTNSRIMSLHRFLGLEPRLPAAANLETPVAPECTPPLASLCVSMPLNLLVKKNSLMTRFKLAGCPRGAGAVLDEEPPCENFPNSYGCCKSGIPTLGSFGVNVETLSFLFLLSRSGFCSLDSMGKQSNVT